MHDPSSWRVEAIGQPDARLQASFEAFPLPGFSGWLGADSDVSVVVRGSTTGQRRVLWLFADTVVAARMRGVS